MFLDDLNHFGPQATPARPPSLSESCRYCRQLAEGHYENFTVASRLLPHGLRQHVCNVYAYCRWADDLADDLADEIGDPVRSLALLDWWEGQLHECYATVGQSIPCSLRWAKRSVNSASLASPFAIC